MKQNKMFTNVNNELIQAKCESCVSFYLKKDKTVFNKTEYGECLVLYHSYRYGVSNSSLREISTKHITDVCEKFQVK